MADEPTIQPGASSRDDPKHLEEQERNVFYATLSPKAQADFLNALERAKESGLSDQEAWQEAVIAAETAYPPDRVDAANARNAAEARDVGEPRDRLEPRDRVEPRDVRE